MDSQVITRDELDAWEKYIIGKPCPKHPNSLVKKGKYGTWCGNRTNLGSWCDCGWPTEEFIINHRKSNE